MREMPGLVDSLVCYIQQEEAGDDKVANVHWQPESFSDMEHSQVFQTPVTIMTEASQHQAITLTLSSFLFSFSFSFFVFYRGRCHKKTKIDLN